MNFQKPFGVFSPNNFCKYNEMCGPECQKRHTAEPAIQDRTSVGSEWFAGDIRASVWC